MNYTTSDAETIFKVSAQTIRNWAKEFSRYLSVTGNPEEGRTRIFTEEDMRVLDLVSQMKTEGKQYDEIHVSLAVGQRGDVPSVSADEVRALVAGEVERRLHLEIQALKRQLTETEKRLETYKQVNDENIRLQANLDTTSKQVEELKEQLKTSQEELRRLEREVGEAYYKGRLDEARNRSHNEDPQT